MVASGRVSVNGKTVRDMEYWVDLAKDILAVDQKDLASSSKVYLMLNKPQGLVTTTADEKDRATVYECLQGWKGGWVAPVGRLDKASEGLLLFTNDTVWADRILAPATHLDKTYHVQVNCLLDEEGVRRLHTGVRDPEGDWLAAKQARLLRRGEKNCWLEIVLDEGKNRHIRRMLQAFGLEVLRLIRTAIGPIALGELEKSRWRALTPVEKSAVDRAIGGKKAPATPSPAIHD